MPLPVILVTENNRVVLSKEILLIPEFKSLWENTHDLTPFQYIWAMYDPQSPYFNIKETEKHDHVVKDFPEVRKYLDDEDFLDMDEKAKELFHSPVREILDGTKHIIEKLSRFYKETEITSGKDGNLAQIKSSIVDLPKIIKAYQDAESEYYKEVEKVRGSSQTAVDEDVVDNFD